MKTCERDSMSPATLESRPELLGQNDLFVPYRTLYYSSARFASAILKRACNAERDTIQLYDTTA